MTLRYSEFESFVNKMEGAEREFIRWLEKFLLYEAARALKLTKKATPVDTELLRKSWSLSDVQVSGGGIQVSLVNNVKYASYVEYGWRRGAASYAGAHMATVALAKVGAAMPARFETQFAAWLNSKLGG